MEQIIHDVAKSFKQKQQRRNRMTKKILVVDDDKNLQVVISDLLEAEGFEVIKGNDGEEAIRLYEQHIPDLVLLDIQMPKLDGYQAFFQIKEKFSDAKVVFMTGFAVDDETYRKAKDMSLVYLLMKPFSFDVLKETLNEVLNEKPPMNNLG